MIGRDFWYDVMRSGAILGIVMALMHVVEQYILVYSDKSLMSVSALYLLAWTVSAVIFIWLLVRFSKRRAAAMDPKFGYSYSLALSYILMISMLAGVIVGVVGKIYIAIMGYDLYVEGLVGRVEDLRTIYAEANLTQFNSDFDKMIDALRTAEQPSMLSSVFSSFNTYIFTGGLPGLIIAAIVSRKPKFYINDDENNE